MSVTIVVGGGGAGVRVGELYSGGGGKCPNTGCVATIQNPRDATAFDVTAVRHTRISSFNNRQKAPPTHDRADTWEYVFVVVDMIRRYAV